MGSTGSKLVKKFLGNGTEEVEPEDNNGSITSWNSSYLVLSRRGSMFFDEDGDLAHEFYEEVQSSRKGTKASMKRIMDNLIPQGEVTYKHPRLHVDFPLILYDV